MEGTSQERDLGSITEGWCTWTWKIAEAWGQGLEPGGGDGGWELRVGAQLLTSVFGPCPRISSSLAAQMGVQF